MVLGHSLFGTDGIRRIVGQWPLTPRGLWVIGHSIGLFLERYHLPPYILIGYDTRQSCREIEGRLCQGLKEAHVHAESIGLCSTPAVSFLTAKLGASMGLMISASHNPYAYNGLKFFNAQGEKINPQEEAVLEAIIQESEEVLGPHEPLFQDFKASVIETHLSLYEDFLSSLTHSLRGLRIVLDCAHGSLSHSAPRVIERCGGQIAYTLGTAPDGHNINAGVGSLHPEKLCQAVQDQNADLGIGFDGDGDRLIIVDEGGHVMDGDQILACLSFEHKNGVVGTIMSNLGLEQFLNHHHIPFVRSDVGDRRIAEKLRELNWSLGGEPCGHIILHSLLPTGDGLMTGLLIADFIKHKGNPFPLFYPVPSVLKNIPLRHQDVLQWPQVKEYINSVTEGLQGRLLLRSSGTEPLLRLLVEGSCLQSIADVANLVAAYLETAQDC